MRKFWKIITISAMSVLISISATVPTVAKPQLAGMTNAQQTALKSLGIKVAVPGYTPQSFQVAGITTECSLKEKKSNPGKCRFGPSYKIIYRSPRSACFTIEGASGGLGGPDLERVVPVKSKLFGLTKVGFFHSQGFPERGIAESDHLSSDWLTLSPSSGPFYRLYSREWKPDGCTSKVTPQEAVKIVESLEWLS